MKTNTIVISGLIFFSLGAILGMIPIGNGRIRSNIGIVLMIIGVSLVLYGTYELYR